MTERARRNTNKHRLWRILSDGRWHSNAELHRIAGFRYGARLMELRQLGKRIHSVSGVRGLWRYRFDARGLRHGSCVGPCCRVEPPVRTRIIGLEV